MWPATCGAIGCPGRKNCGPTCSGRWENIHARWRRTFDDFNTPGGWILMAFVAGAILVGIFVL